MSTPPPEHPELDADEVSVVRVLHRDYRKMTAHDVANSHALTLLTEDRVQAALNGLEAGGFVQHHTHTERTGQREHTTTKYGLTALGRALATDLR